MRPIDEKLLRLDGENGWTLPGSRCAECDALFHPLRARCPRCGSADLQQTVLPKRGRLVSFTRVHQTTPEALVPTPYYIGIVQIDDGPVVEALGSSTMADRGLRAGAVVRLVLETVSRDSDGEEVVAYRFARDDTKEEAT